MSIDKDNTLVWLDLEMTGLDIERDLILEIATVITDQHLKVIATGPSLAIHQNDMVLAQMNAWCIQQHGLSGLTERVRKSNIDILVAEELTLNFIKKYVKNNKSPLCGNSICTDRRFLIKYMPKLESYLNYRNLDVSSFKIIANQWYPHISSFRKTNKHLALDDIFESIAELKYYRQLLFK